MACLNNKVSNYKLRGECYVDVAQFLEKLIDKCNSEIRHHRFETINIFQDPDKCGFPDCDLEFSTTLSLEQIRDLLKLIPDSHVMLQTVELAENYTGERNYDI